MSISGNMVGMYSTIGKTFVLVDESGSEITGIITENVQVFDATPADVNVGKKFASNDGFSIGTQEIPDYNYAIIDVDGLCYEVRSTSMNCATKDGFISVFSYSTKYLNKYYNIANDKWYLENTFQTEWNPN